MRDAFSGDGQTKLHAPRSRPVWVKRAQLTSYLAGTAARLVLVDAPAGFGKTTLVAQWRSSAGEGRRFAWVSLDRGDDDPGSLWWHVVNALQRACPEIDGDVILTALRVQADRHGWIGAAHPAQRAGRAPAPVVLVLDDYHVIKNGSCHDQIAFLLHHLPPSAQLVLITRADPPLPLARLRAAGEMVEIRARELRFAPAEAAALVHAVAGIELSEPDLADLVERTEGWPAGVYLAALSLRGHPSPSTFVRQFTGDNRFIVDFLAEEVLSRQPAEIRQFLVRTSVLGRFCAPLCDAVAGSANAAEIIERARAGEPLRRAAGREPAVVPLSPSLRAGAAQPAGPDRARHRARPAPAGQRLASAGRGRSDEAISHALAAGDVAAGRRPHRALLVRLRRCRPGGDGSRLAALARRRPDRRQPGGGALRGLGRGHVRRPGIRAPLAAGYRGRPGRRAAAGRNAVAEVLRRAAARRLRVRRPAGDARVGGHGRRAGKRPGVAVVRAGQGRAWFQPVPVRRARSGGAHRWRRRPTARRPIR